MGIYTVVIIGEGNDVSTASFKDRIDAIDYCLEEISMLDDSDAFADAEQELEEQMFYDTGYLKFYIEESTLN